MKAEEIRKLANLLMFELEDNEIAEIIEEFNTFEKQISLLEAIDTEGVSEMVYARDVLSGYMWQDEESHVISQEEATVNAAKVKEGHIVVPKVVQ